MIEYKNGGRYVVLSRRSTLRRAARERGKVRKSIVVDAVLTGRVVSVLDFGAFVDLGGGIQGLLHVSEMSGRAPRPRARLVAPGDQIPSSPSR